ncbi:hypothetical protein BU25DRAFT_486437 [Macroventuria anomochaeta]|uniref:Uncharacterized protein n=1 Tax=Macroventuria anomochaeta TaxID=301207 RepID=A0ACB6SIW8_9PLEO|nr:uncharacterized protein BU25DRAFT_486437 [Macroventuria anomochaeta]KAF2633309.1 hypothetical protein BU25DRAFT_486437 [Macroventuria anomochaeta]
MSVKQPNTMSRILKLLKSKSEPGLKGRTIKKAAPGVQIGDSQSLHSGPDLGTKDEGVTFPYEYYKPRPTPKSFVVGEVRKMSNNGSSPDSPRSQGKRTNQDVATTSNPDFAPRNTGDRPNGSNSSPTPSPKSTSSDESKANQSSLRTSRHSERPRMNGVHEERYSHPTVNLLLGQQDSNSPYFTRRYFSFLDLTHADSTSQISNDAPQHLSELDPQAFDLYKIYLHIGKIVFKYSENVKTEHTWIACWPLMNAQILGCIIEEPDFTDRVMDALAEKLTPGICPDVETIQHLFDDNRQSISEELKRFVVDRFVDTQQQSHSLLGTATYPVSFKQLALQTALHRLSGSSSSPAKPGCHYHVHGTSEACYKTRLTAVDTLKERRLAEARESSARDAEIVAANIMHNGVKSVDWEKRRADANRALRIETGRTWMGFRRLEGGKPMEDPVNTAKPIPNQINGETTYKYDSDCLSNDHGKVPLMNGTMSTFDLTRTPSNSPVLQNGDHGVSHTATTVSVMQANGELLRSATTDSYTKSPGHDLRGFPPAELEGSSVKVAPCLMNITSAYERGVNRVPNIGGQTSSNLVVNGASHTDANTSTSSGSTSASDRPVEQLGTKYERWVKCPGAYPESNLDS